MYIRKDATLDSLFYLETALHVSGGTTIIIRSANNCIYNIWNLSDRYCYILIYIQKDATLHSLFYLETALHVSGGTSTHHQERKQLYLQHLEFVRPLLLYSNIYPKRCNFTQFILSGNCSTCFRWYHHPPSGAQTTVFTAAGICQTVTATCR